MKIRLLTLLLLSSLASAQYLTITGVVRDPLGRPYQNGSGRVVLVPQNQQWLINNTNPVTSPVPIGGLDSFGSFSIQIPSTAVIAPSSAGPQWQFSFCSQSYAAQPIPVCFTMTPLSLTTSQDISATIQAQAAYLPLGGGGQITTPIFNQTLYVGDGILGWAGADIGAQVNSAYAALPSTGGEIVLVPQNSGGCYPQTTPISFTTVGKSVIFRGLGNSWSSGGAAGGSCLNFTPTSGTAISIDWSPNTSTRAVGSGIRDITLINNNCNTPNGCGGTAVGISVGGTNGGAAHSLYFGLHILGFATGFKNLDTSTQSWDLTFEKDYFDSNSVAVDLGTGFEAAGFHATRFVANDTHFTATGGDSYFVDSSFDGHGTTAINLNFSGVSVPSFAEFNGCHFENAATGSNTHFITGNGNWMIIGGVVADDIVGGTPDYFFHAGGGYAAIENLVVAGSRVATQIVQAASPVRVVANVILSGTIFSSPVVTTGYTNASVGSFPSNNSNAAQPWIFESPIVLPGDPTTDLQAADKHYVDNHAMTGGGNPVLENCTTDQTGNSFPSVTSLTNYFNAHWEFIFATTTYINCQVFIPTAQAGATIVVDVYSPDSTAGHTANIQTCDQVVNSGTMNAGALTCAANQTFTTTSTAYNRVTLTFNVQSTLSNNSILLIKIGTSPTGTAPTSDIFIYPHFIL